MNGAFRLLLLLSLFSPVGCATGPNGKPWPLALRQDSAADPSRTESHEIPVETPQSQPSNETPIETVDSDEPLDPRTELLLRQLGTASDDPGIQDFVRRRLSDAPSETDSSSQPKPSNSDRSSLSSSSQSNSSQPSPSSASTPAVSTDSVAHAEPHASNTSLVSAPAPANTALPATPSATPPATTVSPSESSTVAVNPATPASVNTVSAAQTTVNSPPKTDPAVVPAAAITEATDSAVAAPPVNLVAAPTPLPSSPAEPIDISTANRQATPPPILSPTPEATPETAPAARSSDHDWLSQLEDAYQSLDRYLAAETDSLEANQRHHLEIRKRLLAVAAGKRDEALSSIEPLSPELQQFWKEQTFALLALTEPDELDLHANFRIGDRRRFAVGLDHLRQAEASLADEAALRIHRVALCDRVDGFGKFHEFPRASFRGDDRLVIYCEVDNFRSETRSGEAGEGQVYETELHGSVVILDQNRREVNLTDYQPIVDRCRFRRRDFYLHFTYTIPRDLPAGRYFISVVLEDVKAKKTSSSAPLELEVR